MMCPIRFGGSWNFDVTFMRWHYLPVVWEVNCDWLPGCAFVDNIYVIHYKNEHCSGVCNGLICRYRDSIQILRRWVAK
jgi:hypothetical protein